MLSHIHFDDLTQTQRLFHGRGHAYQGLEHVNVDWFAPVILITLYQEVDADWLAQQVAGLRALISPCKSVMVQYRCRSFAPIELYWGETIQQVVVQEHGLRYQIDFTRSQNLGLFLDMRNGRQWLMAQAKDKTVLNLFAYTCAFSVAAIAGKANKVVNLDLSKASLARGRENHRLNQHDLSKVVFEGVDIFKSNSRIKKHGPYDILVCDPPSFQKGSVNIQRDYGKILRKIPQWMRADEPSLLMLCLNSPDLDEAFLQQQVAEYCPQARFIEKLDNPAVFKEAVPGKGLKVLLYQFYPA